MPPPLVFGFALAFEFGFGGGEDANVLARAGARGNNGGMTTSAGTSPLQGFLDFMAEQARAYAGVDLEAAREDLDTLLALAVEWYAQLGRTTRRAAGDAHVLEGLRQAHAKYHEACQPVLRLIERARLRGDEPARVQDFMQTVGEAYLIGYRRQQIDRAERDADAGHTRPLAEVRDELQRRVRATGG